MAGHLREALTDDDLDEQAVSNTNGWPDSAPSVAAPIAPATGAAATGAAATAPHGTAPELPLGSCTLRDGTKITLRELDGEDESVGEVLSDQLGVTLAGASKGTYTRVMALCSIDTIDGKEQAPVRHMEQLQRLMKYKSKDQLTLMLCYQRFVTEDATGEGTFPGAR